MGPPRRKAKEGPPNKSRKWEASGVKNANSKKSKGTQTFFSVRLRLAGSAACAEGRLQAEASGGFLLPFGGTERLAPVDAATQRFQFLLGLRAIHARGPTAGQCQRALRKLIAKRIVAGRQAVGQTSPTPLLGTFAKARAQGVAFDVPQRGQVMIVILDGKCLEAALIKVPAAGGVPMGVPALRVGVRQPTKELGQLASAARPKQKMPMVRHQTIAQQANRPPLQGLDQHAFERVEIALVFKESQPSHAPVQSVVNKTSRSDSSGAWHCDRLRSYGSRVNHKWSASPTRPLILPLLRGPFPSPLNSPLASVQLSAYLGIHLKLPYRSCDKVSLLRQTTQKSPELARFQLCFKNDPIEFA